MFTLQCLHRISNFFGLLFREARRVPFLAGRALALMLRYDTIVEFNVDSKAEYTA